ncbi:MAG: cytochrome oxidase assembly protein ShyY1 [Mariniflexile sp.]|jgi:cytochrome oxidase assembly protein ShyY1
MKKEGISSAIVSIIVILGAILKILHVEYANIIFVFGLLVLVFLQEWQLSRLKKRVKDLEDN